MILTISLLSWSGSARSVRARTLQLRESSFVEGLMVLGIPKWKIVIFHMIPNLYDTILSRFLLSVTSAIMVEATLSFLGLSDPVEVTWARMINLAYRQGAFLKGAYGWLFAPGVCIALVIVSLYSIDRFLTANSNRVSGVQSYLE